MGFRKSRLDRKWLSALFSQSAGAWQMIFCVISETLRSAMFTNSSREVVLHRSLRCTPNPLISTWWRGNNHHSSVTTQWPGRTLSSVFRDEPHGLLWRQRECSVPRPLLYSLFLSQGYRNISVTNRRFHVPALGSFQLLSLCAVSLRPDVLHCHSQDCLKKHLRCVSTAEEFIRTF